MNRVIVATFHSLEPARRLQQRLRQAGCETVIHDESKLQRFWFLCEPLAAIHLGVEENEYPRTREVLRALDASEHVMDEAVCCPECGSSRVEYPQITRKFLMPVFEAVLMALGIRSREFYCDDCHGTWTKETRVEPELDVLGFPQKSKFWHPEQSQRESKH